MLQVSDTAEDPTRAFGMVLRGIRYRSQSRLALLTAKVIADQLQISESLYYKFEKGTRTPTRSVFEQICMFYAHDKLAVDDLVYAYEKTAAALPPEPILLIAAREKPLQFQGELERIRVQAFRSYQLGKVRVALLELEQAWDIALKATTFDKPTFLIALSIARYRSQLNDHRGAVDVLKAALDLPGIDVEPHLHCSIRLSRAECECRLKHKTGVATLESYGLVIDSIQASREAARAQTRRDWIWIWADALRSRILNLSTTMQATDVELARHYFREFGREARNHEQLAYTLDSTTRRLLASSLEPENAIGRLAWEPTPVGALDGLTKIIATFQQGKRDDAISETRVWREAMLKSGHDHKAWNFARLEQKLKSMAERKERLQPSRWNPAG